MTVFSVLSPADAVDPSAGALAGGVEHFVLSDESDALLLIHTN